MRAKAKVGVASIMWLAALLPAAHAVGPSTPFPILFVAVPPPSSGFGGYTSTFGNHLASILESSRGGDLWIRFEDGTLKNLTQAAGWGSTDPTGFQGANAINVRDPAMHWDGTKAVFSMVVGAPAAQFQTLAWRWQLYEITGLGPSDTPLITKIPNQPANANNINPTYASDDRIIFVSDRAIQNLSHTYPQRDEYELAAINSGLWSLDPSTGDLRLLNHAPSGDATPFVDSFGRVVFTQWDHLQRDQEADADFGFGTGTNCDTHIRYGTFNYASEAANASFDPTDRAEYFPEPRPCRNDLLAGTSFNGHLFNHFFPWTINEDGTGGEILNHLGRHELHGFIKSAIKNDPNIVDYSLGNPPRFNPNYLFNLLQIRESPTQAGLYFGTDATEFGSHAAGQILSLNAPPNLDADHIKVDYVTHKETYYLNNTPDNSGKYRDPLPLSDGSVVVAHTPQTGLATNGLATNYQFRLKTLASAANGYKTADQTLTGGIQKTVKFWDPSQMTTFSGNLWELMPVEVRPRPRPTPATSVLAAPEQQIFDAAGVTPATLQTYLQQNNLALVVARDVTSRDDADKQQPFNLRIANGGTQTLGAAGKIYDLKYLQFFQADLIRGYTAGIGQVPRPGRRPLAMPMHDGAASALNPSPTGPQGSVTLASDGSMAAFVPAQRAMTWQLLDPNDTPVVRERYWITFQPGEIRTCTSCHGPSQFNQAGQAPPQNAPQALFDLLTAWKQQVGSTPLPVVSTPTPTSTATSTATATSVATAVPSQVPSATPTIAGSCQALQQSKLSQRANPADTRFSGATTVATSFDPSQSGMHVVIGSTLGGTSLDLAIPSGVAVNGIGWRVNSKHTRWQYVDPTGSHSGVRRVTVRDRSRQKPGLLTWSLYARQPVAQSLPDVGTAVVRIDLGSPQTCRQILYNGPSGTTPKCRGGAASLSCR